MDALQGAAPSLDEQLSALSHARRRRFLAALQTGNARGIEIGVGTAGIESPEALLAARHNHLPKLEDLGLVRWDRSSHRVTKGSQYDEIEPLLALLDEHGDVLFGE